MAFSKSLNWGFCSEAGREGRGLVWETYKECKREAEPKFYFFSDSFYELCLQKSEILSGVRNKNNS